MIGGDATTEFRATLGNRERLSTLIVGYGVGLGLPLILVIVFSTAFHHTVLFLLPLVFASVLLLCYLLHPRAFAIGPEGVTIRRYLMPYTVPLQRLEGVVQPASRPTGLTIGLARVVGIYGSFGVFWNRRWGVFRVYITDQSKQVELVLAGGSRVIVSPADPSGFVAELRDAAARAGVALTRGST